MESEWCEMTVERKNTEIKSHELYAEGTSDVEPSEKHIQLLLGREGWIADEILISYDRFQGFWRWQCDISPNESDGGDDGQAWSGGIADNH